MPTFRKKPVVIEAVLTRDVIRCAQSAWHDLPAWIVKQYNEGNVVFGHDRVFIKTLDGDMEALPTDWIICGVASEIYTCKPDIFEKTYDAAGEP